VGEHCPRQAATRVSSTSQAVMIALPLVSHAKVCPATQLL
jgi:hypothetical protein